MAVETLLLTHLSPHYETVEGFAVKAAAHITADVTVPSDGLQYLE